MQAKTWWYDKGKRKRNGRIDEEKEKKKKKEVPRATTTYSWKLKIGALGSRDSKNHYIVAQELWKSKIKENIDNLSKGHQKKLKLD